jgi:arylsulfatase A-like enzyme
MAPVILSAILAIPATLLALTGRMKEGLRSFRFAFGVLAFVCCCSLLYIYPRLYDIAVVLFAGGVAVQAARLADAKRASVLRLVRGTVKWMTTAVALLAVVMIFGGAIRERTRIGALVSSVAGMPNVLLLILDTVRASNMSLYGYSKQTTPNIERLAADGVTFEMAVATSPWTLPSHVSMFTGRLPYEFDTNFLIPYGGEHATLADILSQRGYLTAGFVGNLVYCTEESGITSGFVHYEDHQIVVSEFLKSFALGRRLERSRLLHGLFSHYDVFGDKAAAEVTTEFLNWVDDRPTDRPFFVFLNYMDAHEPYLPPARFERRFGTGFERHNELNSYFIRWAARPGRAQMSAEELAAEVAGYDGTIAYVDEQIGILLDKLRDDGLLQNTVVIVASDHGEQFGEHGLHVHGNSLFLPNLHVPLVIAYGDNLPTGRRVSVPVSIRDIPATVMDLTGMSGDGPFPGVSLERYWASEGPDSAQSVEPVFSELTDIRGAPTMKSIIVGRYHYIWGENRIEALFDIESDPAELTSLMRRENQELITRLRRMMAPHIRNDAALWERLPQND